MLGFFFAASDFGVTSSLHRDCHLPSRQKKKDAVTRGLFGSAAGFRQSVAIAAKQSHEECRDSPGVSDSFSEVAAWRKIRRLLPGHEVLEGLASSGPSSRAEKEMLARRI